MKAASDKTLPILVSVPHGGSQVPEEVRDRVSVDQSQILADSDAFTQEIYNVADIVRYQIKADVARAFVDLNRGEGDLPPGNPDGVVKSQTVQGEPIYAAGRQPEPALVEQLLERYHRPYHRRIRKLLSEQPSMIELALDCHSMAAIGPALSPDPGKRRPAICLSNAHGQSCPEKILYDLGDCFRRVFNLGEQDVTLNQPFSGGYITRSYGGNPVPWIQVELSRDLYLRQPYFNHHSQIMDFDRLGELNAMFRKALFQYSQLQDKQAI